MPVTKSTLMPQVCNSSRGIISSTTKTVRAPSNTTPSAADKRRTAESGVLMLRSARILGAIGARRFRVFRIWDILFFQLALSLLFVLLFFRQVFLTFFKLIVWFCQFLAPLAVDPACENRPPRFPVIYAHNRTGISYAARIAGNGLRPECGLRLCPSPLVIGNR